ncbi:MAG: hypothetical protein U0Q15_09210 [Kineosporiaceae bacterium]
MIPEDEFLTLIRDELKLPLPASTDSPDGTDPGLDRTVAWDSLLVLKLVSAVAKRTGRRVAVGKLLKDRNLRSIYDTFAAAA